MKFKAISLSILIGLSFHSTANDLTPVSFDELVEKNSPLPSIQLYIAEQSEAKGNYPAAVRHYKKAIETGIEQASHNVATLLKEGVLDGDAQIEAIRITEQISKNDAEMSIFLANLYLNHQGDDYDTQAFQWLNNAARLKSEKAYYPLARLILDRKGNAHMHYSDTNAGQLLKMAAEQDNNPIAAYEFAKILRKGEILQPNDHQARKFFQLSVKNGYEDASYELGYMSEMGIGGPVDVEQAIRNYNVALATEARTNSLYRLARIYMYGTSGKPVDFIRGRTLLKRAADEGSSEANYKLGMMYFSGTEGYGMNVSKGLEHLDKASSLGFRLATMKLVQIYTSGENGVKPSSSKVYSLNERLHKPKH
ncbi:tetratricopeptide repeat protein [Vibrio alginolyticus]|uniref:SEL1-like repeat protein n=1 Tax=Vibrio alginolyticus TaxID=663 RepID=UPI0006CAA7EE|nr:tetratricopeptide repeat protein [Vibrio alginolyticus]KPM98533.1 hypothetical protein AOG25_08820 [Vibrio alginolyticus]CAH7150176.1 conserved exported hypothetical protein [Vibrio chagasii]CAH7320881.1 conserved exported hypothetical protein [Vibrio chagasii]